MNMVPGCRKPDWLATVSLFALVALPALVNAHHSAVAFDLTEPQVAATGKVIQFIWRSA